MRHSLFFYLLAVVIFFGSNSWSYTRLGRIEGLSTDEPTALPDKDIAVIEIKTTK